MMGKNDRKKLSGDFYYFSLRNSRFVLPLVYGFGA
jgi:hypothetical protein